MEIETIHPNGALHVTLSSADFESNLKKVYDLYPRKKIAVYCNGVTCLKSYIAAQKALDAAMKNGLCF